MDATIFSIETEINSIIENSKKIDSLISEQEQINELLDSINYLRTKIPERTEKLKKLDELFSQITWLDLKNVEEENLLRKIIEKAKIFHSKLVHDYAALKNNLCKEDICVAEIEIYKNALDDFEESVFEVNQIFFSLRKDDEFNDLTKSF